MDSENPATAVVRLDVLTRLAEHAMNDAEFRASAVRDLGTALKTSGYQLNDDEFALVAAFRESLAEAGVDLDLVREFGQDDLRAFLDEHGL